MTMPDLSLLEKWLYQQQTRARLERNRAERRQKTEAVKAELEVMQPSLFDF
jgi:hypothetical protein